MPNPKPLDIHQQELINVVKAAHYTLAIARKTRTTELARRLAEGKLNWERAWEREQERIKLDLDAEVEVHASNLDEALIAAYNNNVPVRRIALDGFGNRYDGGVQQLLVKLRNDGRLGNRDSYQRNTSEDIATETAFPKPIDVASILTESTTVSAPTFEPGWDLTLVEPDKDGKDGLVVPTVILTMDARDPWFARIQKNARPGTPHQRATSCTLYQHPATAELVVYESRETGDVMWDHPVARWVKEHPGEALVGFTGARANLEDQPFSASAVARVAQIGVTVEDMQQVTALGDQLGIRAPEDTK